MTARIQRFDPLTADVETLRKAYMNLLERYTDGHEDRHLGFWIRNNAADVTLTTVTGDTLTAAGRVMLTAIKEYEAQQRAYSAWRAA